MAFGNLQFAVLGLVARRPAGAHGYQLKKELESLCDDFWEINYGRLYRVLDLLAQGGDLDPIECVQRGRPNRRIYRITNRGKQNLDDWLLQAVSADPRPLRDELALKLLFLDVSNVEMVTAQIKQQRSIYLTRLARIVRRRKRLENAGLGCEVTTLIMDGAEMRVQADLAWLDHLQRNMLGTIRP
jgi:DNA-binding PadR family transcriptional regulator